eukprot:355642-Chlamydomonas_euryale.AAC.3
MVADRSEWGGPWWRTGRRAVVGFSFLSCIDVEVQVGCHSGMSHGRGMSQQDVTCACMRHENFVENFATNAATQRLFVCVAAQSAMGFAGCCMVRRIVGIAGVADLRGIKDEQVWESVDSLESVDGRWFVWLAGECTGCSRVCS